MQEDVTRVGLRDAPTPQDIVLAGVGVQPEHCVFKIENGIVRNYPSIVSQTSISFKVFLEPIASEIFINGHRVTKTVPLKNGYRVLLGINHLFRIHCPQRDDNHQGNLHYLTARHRNIRR